MEIPWRDIETGDGSYDWSKIEDLLFVGQKLDRRVIIALGDRSFNGQNIMPAYFPSRWVVPVESPRAATLGGYVSKRWDADVASKLIRVYRAIGNRYDAHPYFEGLATSESALGEFDTSVYPYDPVSYVEQLTRIVNASKTAFPRTRFFWYVNFIKGSASYDLTRDARVRILANVAGGSLALGGPDVMADDDGHAGSVNLFYIYGRKNYPSLTKFCHHQFNDYKQRKDNGGRESYRLATGHYPDDVLRAASGVEVDIHPGSEIGRFWTPKETFTYATQNFGCDYFFWHYQTVSNSTDAAGTVAYTSDDALGVIDANRQF
jgi:hypothetical protein